MIRRNRIFYGFLLLAVTLMISACGGGEQTESTAAAESAVFGEEGQGKQIVVTIFPEYDWVRELLGENPSEMGLTLLIDNGTDLHSYQPSAKDIMMISSCDLMIYVGGESDAWVGDALKDPKNSDRQVICLMDVLGDRAREEESVEGMEGDAEEGEYDEHVWLSLRNAGLFCDAIAEGLSGLDPEHADYYEEQNAGYQEELSELDAGYQEAIEAAPFRVLLFGDRFPFLYLTEDYGLTYYAAFPGCTAETEASFETVSFLASKMDELKLPCLFTIEGSDQKLAQTIIRNTASGDQKILTLSSMQGMTADEIEDGADYLGIMEENLEILREAFGE